MKILVLSNIGMGLYKFRKELLRELISQNNEIYVSFPNDKYVVKFKEMGCTYIETIVDRRGVNPITDLSLLLAYINIIKYITPDIVLTYTIKPNVYGGIACRITNTPYISSITGLGTSLENKFLIRNLTMILYKEALKNSRCVFFQNEPNRRFFLNNKMFCGRTKVIPGSGVNLKQYQYEEYPDDDNVINILFIGRIMKDKGIDELIEAAIWLNEKYPNIRLNIVGFCEETAYYEKLKKLDQSGIINYHGKKDDVKPFIKSSHATILPSYHEGTSNVLLESASSGRPVLATKVAGCLETFDDGISGIGFDVKSIDSLIEAVLKFKDMPLDKKKIMGILGRKKMIKEYDRNIVIHAYLEEINSIKNQFYRL